FYWATNKRDESEHVLREALALDEKNLVANRALAFLYLGTGRAPEAEPYFVAIARNSTESRDQIGLADYYTFVKRYDDARKIVRDVAAPHKDEVSPPLRPAPIDAPRRT